MNRNEQIEYANRQVEIAQNNLMVAEANLKKLKEIPEEVIFDEVIFKVDGVGIGIYLNGKRIYYLAYNIYGNQVKRLRDFLNEKIKFEESR